MKMQTIDVLGSEATGDLVNNSPDIHKKKQVYVNHNGTVMSTVTHP